MPWAPDYVTVEELADFERVEDLVDDAQLEVAIAAASRAIDRHTNRQFGRVEEPETREFTARWSRSRAAWTVPVDDVMTLAGLIVEADVDGDGVHELDLTAAALMRPRNADAEGRPWTAIHLRGLNAPPAIGADGAIQVTARWGWAALPDTIREACLLQASRFAIRRDAPFGVAGSPESGSEVRLLARVDVDVAVALDPFRRRTWTR